LKILRKELKQREKLAVAEVFARCRVVTATCTGCGDKLLRCTPQFDVVVIDEAAQALEAWCWVAMWNAPKVILAGDHLQLPPTVTSDEASRAGMFLKHYFEPERVCHSPPGLSVTLFDRLHSHYNEAACRMLTEQYRMNNLIAKVSSEELCVGLLCVSFTCCFDFTFRYNNELSAHHSVRNHTLQQLYSQATMPPLVSGACAVRMRSTHVTTIRY
jgi:superfamily I DNA and/or RNA helicase